MNSVSKATRVRSLEPAAAPDLPATIGLPGYVRNFGASH